MGVCDWMNCFVLMGFWRILDSCFVWVSLGLLELLVRKMWGILMLSWLLLLSMLRIILFLGIRWLLCIRILLMLKIKVMFLVSLILLDWMFWIWEIRIFLVGWIGGMLGCWFFLEVFFRVFWILGNVMLFKWDWCLEWGMGRVVLNELWESFCFFCDGDMERLCMYWEVLVLGDFKVGILMVLCEFGEVGIVILFLMLV